MPLQTLIVLLKPDALVSRVPTSGVTWCADQHAGPSLAFMQAFVLLMSNLQELSVGFVDCYVLWWPLREKRKWRFFP